MPEHFENLELTQEEGVARLILCRPHAANTIDLALARELFHASIVLSRDPGVRVVLLSAAGENFCAGGDLKSFHSYDGSLDHHLLEVTTYLHAAVSHLARMTAPVVAAVQGVAAGAGLSLACSGDLVIAAESARFLSAYREVGLSPDGAGSWFLPRVVGLRRATLMMLTRKTLTAAEAVEWGLVSEVVADGELADHSIALAAELGRGPTIAMGHTRRLLRASLDQSLETQMACESRALAECAGTEDAAEGINAFLEKRGARFSGR